jgi:hypothetical protein
MDMNVAIPHCRGKYEDIKATFFFLQNAIISNILLKAIQNHRGGFLQPMSIAILSAAVIPHKQRSIFPASLYFCHSGTTLRAKLIVESLAKLR